MLQTALFLRQRSLQAGGHFCLATAVHWIAQLPVYTSYSVNAVIRATVIGSFQVRVIILLIVLTGFLDEIYVRCIAVAHVYWSNTVNSREIPMKFKDSHSDCSLFGCMSIVLLWISLYFLCAAWLFCVNSLQGLHLDHSATASYRPIKVSSII